MKAINKNEILHALQFMLTEDQRMRSAMGFQRPSAAMAREMTPPPRLSAVMMIFFEKENSVCTLFTQRHDYPGVHSGQLSFPGGKREPEDPSMLETAIRETKEEIGVIIDSNQILGQLDELYIPPSHFIVQPYVAWLDQEPQMEAQITEVKEIIVHPFENFLTESALQRRDVWIGSGEKRMNVPCYDVQGRTLWGATAMMITEMCIRLEAARLGDGNAN